MMRKLFICLAFMLCAQLAHAALVVSGSSGYSSNNADTNFTLNLPASLNVGDVLLAQINFGSTSITITPPSNWNLVRVDSNGSDRQYLYSHVVVSGETAGAATAWSLSNSIRVAAVMIGVRSNIAGGTATLAMNSVNSGNSAALSAASFNASAAGMVLRIYGINSGNTTFTTPTGMSSVATQSTASVANGASIFIAYRTLVASGATGTDNSTSSRSGNWIAQSLLLTESMSNCNSSAGGAALVFDVPNLIANKPSGSVRLRAVDSAGNACAALFQNTTQNITFWSAYANPATGTRAVELSANSGSGAFTTISKNSAAPTTMNLSFDANGETFIEARYQDAGSMTLNAQFTGSGVNAGLVLSGADNFISKPAGFCVQSTTHNLNKANYSACNGNYDQCDLFVAAGNPFNLNVSARAWESDTDSDLCTTNAITPNYVQSGIGLSALLIAPAAGVAGSINHATIDITANGTATYNDMTQSEVGVFQFIATPPSYFGQTVSAGTSINYGRFFPHHFSITAGSTLVNRATSCTNPTALFTYLGEALNLNYQINAFNASNALTQNYQGAFAKIATFAQMNTTAIAPSPRAALTPVSMPTTTNPLSVTWSNGRAAVISPVTIAKPANAVMPYLNVAFGVAPTDSDGITTTGISAIANPSTLTPLNLDTNAPADAINDRVQIGSSTELRYGRLRLNSASGPSDVDLPIPMLAEYWNGSRFITNSDDNCTLINGAKATTTALGASAPSGNAMLSGGQSNAALTIKAPGAGVYGNVAISLDLNTTDNNFPWLQFNWDNNAATPVTGPTATASFGTYRGSDRVIFWREF